MPSRTDRPFDRPTEPTGRPTRPTAEVPAVAAPPSQPPDGVTTIKTGSTTISIPKSAMALIVSMALGAGGASVAGHFSTATDMTDVATRITTLEQDVSACKADRSKVIEEAVAKASSASHAELAQHKEWLQERLRYMDKTLDRIELELQRRRP